jgi:hypothetical protein
MPLCERGTSTIQTLADAFLSSPRYVNRNTRRGYAGNPGHRRLLQIVTARRSRGTRYPPYGSQCGRQSQTGTAILSCRCPA